MEFMVKAIDAMDLPEKFLLTAHSYGGYLCSLYASQRPHRVESFFMLSPAGPDSYDPKTYNPLEYNDQIYPNHLTVPSLMDEMIHL